MFSIKPVLFPHFFHFEYNEANARVCELRLGISYSSTAPILFFGILTDISGDVLLLITMSASIQTIVSYLADQSCERINNFCHAGDLFFALIELSRGSLRRIKS